MLSTSGIITSAAQINDALITNAKIQNAAVDTLKVAGDSVTISSYTDFATATLTNGVTKEFSSTVSMAFAGDIIAFGNVQFFGSAGEGDTAQYDLFIDGTQVCVCNYTGSILLGLQTLTGAKTVATGSRTITVRISNMSGITNPSADCQITVLRRFR